MSNPDDEKARRLMPGILIVAAMALVGVVVVLLLKA